MEKRFFKIPEFVEYSSHSRSVVYAAIKSGDLVATYFGKSTRIEKSDGDEWLSRTGVKTAA